jgi:hypothetical protein
MLKNDKYKFVFVHVQKTGGTSVRDELKKLKGTQTLCGMHSFLKDCSYPKNYFKFGFVRNPWDRLVSWYNMHITSKPDNIFAKYLIEDTKNFSDFLKKTNKLTHKDPNGFLLQKSITYNQLEYFSDNDGKLLVDFIGKLENINDDIKIIGEKIGYPQLKVGHSNKRKHNDYRTYYSNSEIELVAEMYKRDIDYFGYSFE